MRTERASFAYLIFAFLIIIGLLSASWVPFVLGAISAAMLVMSSTMAPEGVQMSARRKLSRNKAYEDSEIKVVLEIRNSGSSSMVEIFENTPPEADVEGETHEIRHIKRGETVRLEYSLRFPLKGKYSIGAVKLRCFDPMMFWVREFTIDLKDDIEIYVGVEDLKKVRLEPTKTKKWLGNINSRKRGIGTEFYSIRDYVPGDSVKAMNWKASARRDRLLINEYEGENSGDAIIVLDAKEESLSGDERHNTFKAGVRASLSIASRMLRQRNRVGLVLLGDYLTWIYPEFGRRQLYKMMEALSTLKKGGKWDFDTLYWIITRFFPPNSFIIVVSTLQSGGIPETIMKIKARGYDVLIISPSPVAVEKELLEDTEKNRLAMKILQMKRENVMDALRERTTVIDWDPSTPLGEKLKGMRRMRV